MDTAILTDGERTDCELLGRAKTIIEWLLDQPGIVHTSPVSTQFAREWLQRYEERMEAK